jgi:release factor glutamine methyltransferase
MKHIHRFNLYGFEITVFPKVYCPSDDSFMFCELIKSLNKGYECGLDVGCGCGILSMLLTRVCKHVVAIDISGNATRNTWYNVKLNSIQNKISIVRGNLVDPFKPSTFDLIVFNPPYLPADKYDLYIDEEERMAWCGGVDGRLIIDRFIDAFPYMLRKNGELLLLQSSLSNPQKTLSKLYEMGFEVSVVLEKSFFFEKLYLIRAVRRWN